MRSVTILGLVILGAASVWRFYPELMPWNDRWAAQLYSSNPDERWTARVVLIEQGESAIPLLIEVMNGRNSDAHYEAVSALCRIDANRAAAVPSLIRLLREGVPAVQDQAVQVLREIGPDARAAVEALTMLFETGHPKTTLFIPSCLVSIQGADAVPFLMGALRQRQRRFEVVLALMSVGSTARIALPALQSCAEEEDRAAVREIIQEAMQTFGMTTEEAGQNR